MNNLAPILRALLSQASLNSQFLAVIGSLAMKVDPSSEDAEFLGMFQTAVNGNTEFLALIEAAVSRLETENNG